MADRDEETTDTGSNINPVWVTSLVLIVGSPATALAAVVTYYITITQKIKFAAVFQAVLMPLLLLLGIFIYPATDMLLGSFTSTLTEIIQQEKPFLEGYIQFVSQQIPFAAPLGITAGALYAAHKRKDHPKWKETRFRRTPLEIWKEKKTRRSIEQDLLEPVDGMTLGVDERGERVIQTWEEAAKHTLVFGTVGSGKTTTLLARLRDSIKAGQGAVIIDLKGGPDLPAAAYEYAQRYGHRFQHWTMVSPQEYNGPSPLGPAYYDPISRGDATRRANLVLDMRQWTEDHYRIHSESFLQLAFSVMIANPDPNVTPLADLVSLLDPHKLHQRSINLAGNPEYGDIVREANALVDQRVSRSTTESIDGLRAILSNLLLGTGGKYLLSDPNLSRANNINLFQSAHDGDIVVFSLDSSNYPKMAANMANLVVQDLKTVSSELRQHPLTHPFQVIIDEFSAIGSDNIIGFANKSRDAKMPVTLATQTLGDLRANNPSSLDQLAGLVASFIVHRSNLYGDVEFFAGLTGKTEKVRVNESVHLGSGITESGSVTGHGTIQSFDDYRISPTEIQDLKTGEMIYVHRPEAKVLRVQCIMEKLTDKQIADNSARIAAREESEKAAQLQAEQNNQPSNYITPPSGNQLSDIVKKQARQPLLPDNFTPLTEIATAATDVTDAHQPANETTSDAPPSQKEPHSPADMDRIASIMSRPREEVERFAGRNGSNYSVHPAGNTEKPSPLPVVKTPPPLPTKLPPLPSLPPLPQKPKEDIAGKQPITQSEEKDEFDF